MVRRKSSYANSSAGSLPRTRPLCTSSWAKSLELGRTYVDNDNQIVELKIPVDVVEKNAVAATERLDSAQVLWPTISSGRYQRTSSEPRKSLSFRALTNSDLVRLPCQLMGFQLLLYRAQLGAHNIFGL